MSRILVATQSDVIVIDGDTGSAAIARGLDAHPTCLSTDPLAARRAWCGTQRSGVYRTDDGGVSWRPVGLENRSIMSVTASPAEPNVVWAGTEPSAVWRTGDGGETWEPTRALEELPSSPQWSFPPKPDTHHVRWIACHPHESGKLWVAIEAGALVSTADGGRTWRDRVPGGPWDTHELAIHPAAPNTLRIAAGDGYYESYDAGQSWHSPSRGLDVGYLRSVAIDPGQPDVVVVSASSSPYTAYRAGASDGRLYRRSRQGEWQQVRAGRPTIPSTIAPLLVAGGSSGELWSADERGVHRSDDGGASWRQVAGYPTPPTYLRGLVVLR